MPSEFRPQASPECEKEGGFEPTPKLERPLSPQSLGAGPSGVQTPRAGWILPKGLLALEGV